MALKTYKISIRFFHGSVLVPKIELAVLIIIANYSSFYLTKKLLILILFKGKNEYDAFNLNQKFVEFMPSWVSSAENL